MWKEVTDEILEELGEVLALNLAPGTYGYKETLLGYISKAEDQDFRYLCENEGQELHNVTHYLDPKTIPLPNGEFIR